MINENQFTTVIDLKLSLKPFVKLYVYENLFLTQYCGWFDELLAYQA
jgi:hypothetical protein